QNADRRNAVICRALRARPRPRYGRRTSIGFPPRFSPRGRVVVLGSASGHASWDVAGRVRGGGPLLVLSTPTPGSFHSREIRRPSPPLRGGRARETSSSLEILHGALVLLRGGAAGKGAEIAPLAGVRILFARIEPVFAGGEFANHDADSCAATASRPDLFRDRPSP